MGAATRSVAENAGSIQIQAIRIGSATAAVSVSYSFTNGTALNGTHFTGTAGTLSWPAGDAAPKTINVPIIDDAAANADRTFTVTLVAPVVSANITAPSATTVTITNDDAAAPGASSTIVFSQAEYSTAENAGNVVLTLNRTGSAAAAASVRWATSSGTAIAGTDFGGTRAGQSTGMVSWAAGDAAAKTILVPIKTDTISEPDEDFFVTLSDPSTGSLLGTPGVARVVILGDQTPPPPPPNAETEIGFVLAKYPVLENAGSVTLSVNRAALPTFGYGLAASVSYAMQAGTAQIGSDFTASSGTLDWAAGESGTKTITVPIANDAIAEPHETFKVTLSSPSNGARLAANAATTVLIVDDDELFPPRGAMPGNWTVPAAASNGWSVSSDPGPYQGFFALRSDTIRDGQTAQVEITTEFWSGQVAFFVRVSSEAGYDFLRFYVDGEKKAEWSGTTAWQPFTIIVNPGMHTLRWSYEKDGTLSSGEDAAWLDSVVLPTVTP